jgi:hypothetical protein
MTSPSVVTPADFAGTAAEQSAKPVRHRPTTLVELAEDYLQWGMLEEWVSVSVELERFIVSNALAVVSDDIGRLTGEPAKDFASFVRKALA